MQKYHSVKKKKIYYKISINRAEKKSSLTLYIAKQFVWIEDNAQSVKK